MARSKSPHPRLEVRKADVTDHRPSRSGKHGYQVGPWEKVFASPWQPLYADTVTKPASSCCGLYVIENPKVDDVLRVYQHRGGVVVVRIGWIGTEGPGRVGEERYDGRLHVHRLLLEDGRDLVGTHRFRAKACSATV